MPSNSSDLSARLIFPTKEIVEEFYLPIIYTACRTCYSELVPDKIWDKAVSREVANRASAQTGLSETLLKRMLPVVATLVMGTLARRTSPKRALETPESASTAGDSLMGLLGDTLDQNRDGSMVDDVIGILGRTLGR